MLHPGSNTQQNKTTVVYRTDRHTSTDTFSAIDQDQRDHRKVPLGLDDIVVILEVLEKRIVPEVE